MKSVRLAVVAGVVFAAAIGVLVMGSQGPTAGGPLLPAVGLLVETHLAPGADATWGIPLLAPEGPDPAILDSVMPAQDPVGLTVLGINASIIGDTPIGRADGYPPAGVTLAAVEGMEVPVAGAGERVQLVIGVHYIGPASGSIDGLRVRYTVGGRRYEAVLKTSLRVTPAQ